MSYKNYIFESMKHLKEATDNQFMIVTSVRDARQANDIAEDDPYFKRMLPGYRASNEFPVNTYEDLLDLRDKFERMGIEMEKFVIDGEETDQLDEESTTASVDGYNIPAAFGKVKSDTVNQLGFTQVSKSKKNVKESVFMRMAKQMI
jgi:hypothetical protein